MCPGFRVQPDIPIDGAGIKCVSDRGAGQNREMGSRSQADWRRTGRQRPVRGHNNGHRKEKAHEYLFRSVHSKCPSVVCMHRTCHSLAGSCRPTCFHFPVPFACCLTLSKYRAVAMPLSSSDGSLHPRKRWQRRRCVSMVRTVIDRVALRYGV